MGSHSTATIVLLPQGSGQTTVTRALTPGVPSKVRIYYLHPLITPVAAIIIFTDQKAFKRNPIVHFICKFCLGPCAHKTYLT